LKRSRVAGSIQVSARAAWAARLLRAAVVASALAVLAGCGYRLLGTGTLPPTVRTLAVLPFERQVPVLQIDQRVTEAVVQEASRRLKVRVQSGREGADAVLTGAIRGFNVAPLSYDSEGRADRYQVTLSARVRLTDRAGTILFDSQGYRFTQNYARSGSPSTYASEEVVAYEVIARDFARALVSAMVEGGNER